MSSSSLIVRRTVIIDDERSYAACLLCDAEAKRRMLCDKHYSQAKREGWLWKYPGDYLDDYTEEGQDEIDAFIRWFFAWDFLKFIKVCGGLDISWAWLDQGIHDIGTEGYCWAVAGDSGCADCQGSRGSTYKGRGLCVACYKDIYNDDPYKLLAYPTKTYCQNVEGHIWWALTYHPDRVRDIGEEFGVGLDVKVLHLKTQPPGGA